MKRRFKRTTQWRDAHTCLLTQRLLCQERHRPGSDIFRTVNGRSDNHVYRFNTPENHVNEQVIWKRMMMDGRGWKAWRTAVEADNLQKRVTDGYSSAKRTYLVTKGGAEAFSLYCLNVFTKQCKYQRSLPCCSNPPSGHWRASLHPGIGIQYISHLRPTQGLFLNLCLSPLSLPYQQAFLRLPCILRLSLQMLISSKTRGLDYFI